MIIANSPLLFVSLDLETTGFNPDKDQIIEFGAIKFDLDGNTEKLDFLCDPGIPIPEIVIHITNIHNEDVQGASKFPDKMQEIKDFVQDLPIVGHNIRFDTNFLRAKGIELTNPEYDTCQMATTLLPELPSHSLEVISKVLHLQHAEKHRALDDAIAAMELFHKLIAEFKKLPKSTLDKIKKIAANSRWPLKELIKTLESDGSSNEITKITPPPPGPLNISDDLYQKILNHQDTALFEVKPPYNNLVRKLSSELNPNSYISLPANLFEQIEADIPANIAKIAAPKNYISPRRLDELMAEKDLEEYQASAIAKYIIWLEKTESGLISEIPLFQEERRTVPEVNADPNFTDPKDEAFFQKALKKDENNPAICTHDYAINHLLATSQQVTDLVILDLPSFHQKLNANYSVYIKLDILEKQLENIKNICPEAEFIDELNTKCTILFGIIGMLFTEYNDKNLFAPRLIITNLETQMKAWQDIKAAIKSIIEISHKFGELNNTKTYGHLQKWKKSLKALDEVFFKTNLEENMIWIEQDSKEQHVLRMKPYSTNKATEELLSKSENYRIISENLDLADNANFSRKIYGLAPDPKLYQSQEAKEFKIAILEDIPPVKNNDHISTKFVESYVIKSRGKTALVLNSKKKLQEYTIKLTKSLKKEGINVVSQLTGSLGKIRSQFMNDPENSLLILTPHFWSKFERYDLIDNLLVQKIPFDPPSDPKVLIQNNNFRNAFIEFQVPMAIFNLKRIVNRMRKDAKEVVILDSRIVTKDYCVNFRPNLETIADVQVLKQSSFA